MVVSYKENFNAENISIDYFVFCYFRFFTGIFFVPNNLIFKYIFETVVYREFCIRNKRTAKL